MFLDIIVNTLQGRRDFADKKKGPIKKTTLTPTLLVHFSLTDETKSATHNRDNLSIRRNNLVSFGSYLKRNISGTGPIVSAQIPNLGKKRHPLHQKLASNGAKLATKPTPNNTQTRAHWSSHVFDEKWYFWNPSAIYVKKLLKFSKKYNWHKKMGYTKSIIPESVYTQCQIRFRGQHRPITYHPGKKNLHHCRNWRLW